MTKAKPKKATRFRYAKRIAIGLFAIVALGLLTFPIWSVWITPTLARNFAGAQMGDIERVSWRRWEVSDVSWSNQTTELSISRVTLPSPAQLLLQQLSLASASQDVVVEDWILNLTATGDSGNSAPPPSMESIIGLVKSGLDRASKYITSASLTNGTVNLNGDELLAIESASADSDSLSVKATHVPTSQTATLTAKGLQSDTWQLAADSHTLPLSADLTLKQTSERLSLRGNATSAENTVELTANWPASSPPALPDAATLSTASFQLDGRYGFWSGSPPLEIDATVDWQEQAYTYRILGSTTDTQVEEPTLNLAGNGTLSQLKVTDLQVLLPWLTIDSSKPIVFDFSLENPLESAELVAELDLGKLPVIEAQGTATASVRTLTSEGENSRFLIDLQGNAISFFDTTIDKLNSNIEYEGTVLKIKQLSVATANQSTLDAKGSYDVASQSILESSVALTLNNESDRLAALLPQIGWDRLSADLEATGAPTSPGLTGVATAANIKVAGIPAADIQADINGSLQQFRSKLQVKIPEETLNLELSVLREENGLTLGIESLALTYNEGSQSLDLQNPFTARIHLPELRIGAQPIALSGEGGERSVRIETFSFTPTEINTHFSASHLSPTLFQNWLETQLPPLFVDSLEAKLDLTDKGLVTSSSGLARWSINEENSVDLSWALHSDSFGTRSIEIDDMKIGSNAKHILAASGTIPVSAKWSQSKLNYSLNADVPFALSLESSPHPDFWRSIEKYFPIGITRPVAKAELKGTLDEPEGFLKLQLARLTWTQPNDPSKSVELQNIDASFVADSQALTVESLSARAGGNELTAHATVPLKQYSLTSILEKEQPIDLNNLQGQATLRLDDLPTLQTWLPAALRAQGSAEMTVEMKPENLTATIEVKNLATRPLPPLGSLSEISGKLNYEQGEWRTEALTGLAEGNPFRFTGNANISDLDAPTYDLRFTSEAFPIVRDSGLLLSGDIDLKLVSTSSEQTALFGSVTLTKGLVLVEPELLASSTKTVQTQPPYFSVEQEPFDSWDLDVEITGDEFMRVSNSFFEGTLSADFNLQGTLGSPLLIGRAQASTGQIFFPASSLRLTRGQALITREQPNVLQVEAAAEGRLFAYDVNLTVSGPATDPDIIITTNPALTQVEALLLLTTGTVPDSNNNLAQNSATSLGMFIGKGLFRKLAGNSGDAASKLSLEVGQDISLQGKKTIEATYQLTEDLEVEGEYDKRDEFNANLKWTFFEK